MSNKSQSILIGGGVAGVAAFIFGLIPVAGSCLDCLGVVGTGLLAVWHYTNSNEVTLKAEAGVGMGALAGMVNAVVRSLLIVMSTLVGPKSEFSEQLEIGLAEAIASMAERGVEPEQIEMIENMVGSSLFIPGVFLCGFIVYVLLGALGGVIGAAIFKKGTETLGEASDVG